MADISALKAVAAKIAAQIGVPDAAEDLPTKALEMMGASSPTTRETRNDRRFPNTNQVSSASMSEIESPAFLISASSIAASCDSRYIACLNDFCRSMHAGRFCLKP
jgi:hypothetical protein